MRASIIAPSRALRSAPRFNHARHFALLTAIAVALVITGRWGISPGIGSEFALYGGLHAASLTLSSRDRQAPARQLLFIAAAALLSSLTVRLGISGFRWAPRLSLGTGHYVPILVIVCSGLGALAYGALIGRLFDTRWSRGALGATALACALTSVAAFLVCRRYQAARGLWLAIPWWYAFSAALALADSARARRVLVPVPPDLETK
jgi:hypothetical protein